jgi:hypothetical protein
MIMIDAFGQPIGLITLCCRGTKGSGGTVYNGGVVIKVFEQTHTSPDRVTVEVKQTSARHGITPSNPILYASNVVVLPQ